MAWLRFRGRRVRGEPRLEWRIRVRRPAPTPAVPFEGVPPCVVDLGSVGEVQAAPVDLGTIKWPAQDV